MCIICEGKNKKYKIRETISNPSISGTKKHRMASFSGLCFGVFSGYKEFLKTLTEIGAGDTL